MIGWLINNGRFLARLSPINVCVLYEAKNNVTYDRYANGAAPERRGVREFFVALP